ncbi:MAG: tryptophan--tRNA ligase, partial [Kiritimatiellae bacterium]|nr:tryptophan--tRNA ligase [Kiritimatiellia bacterium]
FTIPEPSIRDDVAVVPGLDGQKMSKSYDNTIELFAPLKDVKARIMRVVTDSKTLEEPKDPTTCNLFALYRLFATDAQRQEMEDRYRKGGLGYGHVKKELFEMFDAYFAPIRRRRDELAGDPGYVEGVLKAGAERARAEAVKTLRAARQAVGLEYMANG